MGESPRFRCLSTLSETRFCEAIAYYRQLWRILAEDVSAIAAASSEMNRETRDLSSMVHNHTVSECGRH